MSRCQDQHGTYRCAREDGHDGPHWNSASERAELRARLAEAEARTRSAERAAADLRWFLKRVISREMSIQAMVDEARRLDGDSDCPVHPICADCNEPTDAGPCPGCGKRVCQLCAEREGEFCCDGEAPQGDPEGESRG